MGFLRYISNSNEITVADLHVVTTMGVNVLSVNVDALVESIAYLVARIMLTEQRREV